MVLSVTAMFLDYQSVSVKSFHDQLSIVVAPVQQLVNEPVQLFHAVTTSLKTQRDLLADNARLRAEQLLLNSKMQKLLTLEYENSQLRELLQSKPQATHKVMSAQLLAIALDPRLQQVIVDRGSKDDLYLGQPVLDPYGVFGQIVSIGPITSRVLLVTDSQSALPVRNYRTGSRAIAMGTGDIRRLRLANIPDTKDIQEGDLYVASGMGLRFPVGYPVGVVEKFSVDAGERFATIYLIPTAHLDKTEQVLLAWPKHEEYDRAIQEQLSEATPRKSS